MRYINGVLRVVGAGQLPTPVEDDVIQGIRGLIKEDGYACLAQRPLAPGERVAICRGPLEGISARIEQEWDDGRRVAILLETIQTARVVIGREYLEPAAA